MTQIILSPEKKSIKINVHPIQGGIVRLFDDAGQLVI